MPFVKSKQNRAVFHAVLAAALYAISAPVSKLLLKEIPPMTMAALLYVGAGTGMLLLGLFRKWSHRENHEAKLERKDLPYTIAMVVLDIAAPILLMFGLMNTTAANVSLLNNFEIVATALIALALFHERIGLKLWAAIVLVSFASILLSIDDLDGLDLSFGSLYVIAACVCWGLENNCTRSIAQKDPLQIVVIKGFGAGIGAYIVARCTGEQLVVGILIPATLALGFVAYGLSIYYYTYAQRIIGAARTSTYYAACPFIGVLFSFLIVGERPDGLFFAALLIMIAGTILAASENK